MDVFSHFVLPYLVVHVATRDRRAALAAGIGAFSPDVDALTAILALWDPLYFLGHRGVSHSLLGAPLYALGTLLLLRARFWRRLIPIHDELRFGPRLALLAVAFSYTHLALDALTHWGVPLLYPWSVERISAGWFFYSVGAMVPVSIWVVWRTARGTDTARGRRVALVLLVAILVVAGGVRAATYPDDPDIEVAYPAAAEWSWTALERTQTGWRATFYSWGREIGQAEYLEPPVRDPQAAAAVERAKGHVEYRAFELYTRGPHVTQVEPREEGGWNVTFLDLQERAQADRAPWFPLAEKAGKLAFAVHEDGRVEELDR